MLIACAALAAIIQSPLLARQTEARVRGKLDEAAYYLHTGNLADAQRVFEEVLKDSGTCRTAHAGLGEIFFRQQDWDQATDHFEAVLETDPENLRAHYGAAVAYREFGTQAALIMRASRWGKSQEHFDFLLARDSSYDDLLYQFALLRSYNGATREAINLTRLQLRSKPTLLPAQMGLMKFYGDFIRDVTPQEAVTWLESRGSEFSLYFLGELYRRKRRDLQADTLFAQLLVRAEEVPRQAILLSLVRLYARQNKPELVDRIYWRAVNEATSQFGVSLLFNDIKYLLTDAELSRFDSLRTAKEKLAFFRTFWTKRNPTPASSLNPRLMEHYQRLVFAEANYEFRGIRTRFNNPDQFRELQFPRAYALNHEFSDKGLVYLRFGEPDWSDIALDNEVWVYEGNQRQAQMIFHFVLMQSAGGNWRLSPLPTNPRSFEFLSSWDNKYYSYLNHGEAGRQAARDEIAHENSETIMTALTTERPTAKKDFYRFVPPMAVDAFRGESGSTSLDISYGIPLTVLAQKIFTQEADVALTISITLRNLRGEVVQTRLDSLSVHVTKESRGTLLDLFRTTVQPDSLSISLYLESPALQMIGEAAGLIEAHDFGRPELQMSDVQFLLESPRKPKMEVEGVKVVPSPFRRIPSDKPFRLYHHLYHLRTSGRGATQWGMEYVLTPVRLKNRSAKQAPLRFSFDKNGTDEFADQFFVFNTLNAQPGIYQLHVRATDRISELVTERTVLLELY